MMEFDRITLGRQAKELGFVRDTFEKVCRLVDVLSFMEGDSLLSDTLALKGGTAINLTVFDLPRLSVDIDLDYAGSVGRDDMLKDRAVITDRIQKHMAAEGYMISPRSKQVHALDSFVYDYINAGGVRDNLKIEINYMLRCHIRPLCRRTVKLPWPIHQPGVLCVDPVEIFSAKTVALLTRAAARDLYDVYNLSRSGIITSENMALYTKCVMFYSAVSQESVPESFQFGSIDRISLQKIRTDLFPALRGAQHFDLPKVQEAVREFLSENLRPEETDKQFWDEFRNRNYKPELLFDDPAIVERIKDHPMALWKCRSLKPAENMESDLDIEMTDDEKIDFVAYSRL